MTAVQTIKMLGIWISRFDPATALLPVAGVFLIAVTCFAAFKIARDQP
jgi:hypothetical protein